MMFFFNDTATTEIYTLSLHDALPICSAPALLHAVAPFVEGLALRLGRGVVGSPLHADLGLAALLGEDRKSTRLNSSHSQISYAVFCLKKIHIVPPSHHQSLTVTLPPT